MATTRLMPLHIGKGQTAGDAIKRALGYIKDPIKTENGILVTSYGCTPQTAEAEFMLMRREYLTITGRRRGKDDVLAYHLRQSFKPGEITPEEANRIGCELAKRFTHGDHAFIVATHTNTSSVQKEFCQGIFCAIIFCFILTNTFEVHPDKSLAFFIESETVLKDAISYSYI